ncbi:ACT domain-containing protein [Sinisalibacter aestuarii]|uniref:Aspartate kinase n=1 Tax=Sinisalibacter aestuarii TaxID=2949426 RepID=A0ABQ5LVJ4_9RHOB|nr:ACT domain-containing protein [Sinisalibacter aestuarii]GKY89003.1 hypothetical protein STA1M1_28720 [Sinisalibacter aestuarii]
MVKRAETAHDMVSGMTPELRAGRFVFVTITDSALEARLMSSARAVFREAEGTSLLIPGDVALKHGLNADAPMRGITLNVYSSLHGVGLTAAVSGALADHDIPCNMIAAFHHDHVFVPEHLCERAVEILRSLQDSARREP